MPQAPINESNLTATEFAIYEALKSSPGRPLTEDEIADKAGRIMYGSQPRWHIKRMRKKLPPGTIVNIRTRGYMLVERDNVCGSCGTVLPVNPQRRD